MTIRTAPASAPAAVIALAALTVAGCGQAASAVTPSTSQPSIRPSPVRPHLTQTERKYYGAAWRATVARDHACDGSQGPTFATGSLSRALSSRFAILRRPATPAGRLPALLHQNLPP